MPTTWFVTGAQGFLGRYTVRQILNSEPDAFVIGLGRSPQLINSFSHRVTSAGGPVPAPLPPDLALPAERYRYRSVDLSDTTYIQALIEEFRPNYIIHLASGLRGDPLSKLLQSNLAATHSLFEALRAVPGLSPVVVLGSTGGVYGRLASHDLPVRETHCPHPVDEYAITKLATEQLARSAAHRLEVPLVVARIFNLLGPAQDERHVAGEIVLQLCRIRNGAEPIVSLGALEATRDFLDVRDTASALVGLATLLDPPEIVNVASGRECSIVELLQCFLKRSTLEVTVQRKSAAVVDVPRHVGDITRLAGLGLKQNHTLETSVDSIWNYYLSLWAT